MAVTKAEPTIDEVLCEFLADQRKRLKHGTYRQYEDIVDLFRSYLEHYWPGRDDAYDEVTEAGGSYCGTFGPEEISCNYHEFLGYFMPRKVVCGAGLLQAAGRVTRKLARWLEEKGYDADTEDAQELARQATRELPEAERVTQLLDHLSLGGFGGWDGDGEVTDEIEDHFTIVRVRPGKLWLEPLLEYGGRTIGPIPVPAAVTERCREGWDIGGILGKTRSGWGFVEVWNVTP